ncbi:MAG: phosphoglucosamine mutase, partial [Deltaproteobacteria bacterium]|nr:phosphoglucosamine mutase [Deltaproteobacteria bacterium]
VTTVMSNMGLKVALDEMGIEHLSADVGDRHVMEMMINEGANLGGEDSGHMIFLDHHTTGDGLLAALQLLGVMIETGDTLSKLKTIMTVFPQTLINVTVSEKPPISEVAEIQNAIETAEKQLGDRGRVLVRYSGTQLKCRVMVEGPTVQETQTSCELIADAVRKRIGK